ncbi:MAG: VWA domain-containing protein [Nocardioides sp.]|uniref:vWA domain-containing protein n=1 Tax=Nocardioides sp. TaxID=35761 RepID=UPI0039E6E0A0
MSARATARVGRRVGIVLLMLLILARPGWGHETVRIRSSSLDVVVVVDRTRSMIAQDGPGHRPRLDLVRRDLRSLAGALPGVRFAAVSFGGEVVRTELPFTTDVAAFDAFVDALQVEGQYDGVGSRIDAPLRTVSRLLAEDAGSHPDRRRIVVLVSDGENTAPGDQASFVPWTTHADGGVVLGYGTTPGGPMLQDQDRPSEGYVSDPSDPGQDAISHYDGDNLAEVADQLDVKLVHRTDADQAEIRAIATGFGADERDSRRTTRTRAERTYVFALGLLPLLAAELWSQRRAARRARELLR